LACYWRRRADGVALPWACLTLTYALFALPTRIHERYLFPALVFTALLAALTPGARWLYAGMSLTYLANLYYVYAQFYLPPGRHVDVLLVLAALLVGAALRFADPRGVPPALNQDEAVIGYDAYSLLHTGRDHLGHPFPFAGLESFGDWVSPLLTFLTVPAVG